MASDAGVGGRSRSSRRPCVRCKFLRQKCVDDCIFAPYFPDIPGDDLNSERFANIHKMYGASNVSKMLNELDPSLRQDAVNSLVFEAEFRIKDPVYGCVGHMYQLQQRLSLLYNNLHQEKTRLAAMINIQEQQQHNNNNINININDPATQISDHMNFNLDQHMLLNSGFNNPPLVIGDPQYPLYHQQMQLEQGQYFQHFAQQEQYSQYCHHQQIEQQQQQQVEAAVPPVAIPDAMTDETIQQLLDFNFINDGYNNNLS